jgi:DNA-binding transcriptional ArsR family regulator
VRIVNLLATAGEPVCACNLNEPVGLAQPTVSHHLKKLAMRVCLSASSVASGRISR